MSSDQIANFTYSATQGARVLDYILVVGDLLPRIAKFTMMEIFCCDYLPFTIELKCIPILIKLVGHHIAGITSRTPTLLLKLGS